MALSIREQIIQAAVSRLNALTPDGCLRCVPYTDEDQFVALWDQAEDAEPGAFNRTNYELPLAVVYTIRYSRDDSPSKTSEMLADLMSAMFTPDDDFGGLADGVFYTGSSVKHRESGSDFISVGAVFTVTYTTRAGDPFNK